MFKIFCVLLLASSSVFAGGVTGSTGSTISILQGTPFFVPPPTCNMITEKVVWENSAWLCVPDNYAVAAIGTTPVNLGFITMSQLMSITSFSSTMTASGYVKLTNKMNVASIMVDVWVLPAGLTSLQSGGIAQGVVFKQYLPNFPGPGMGTYLVNVYGVKYQ